MIFNLEIKVEVSKDCLNKLLAALGGMSKLPEYAYDISVNARTLFGLTTGYEIVVKTKSTYVIQTVINNVE